MKSRVSIRLDPKMVGEAFAHTDDEAQAEMLNEMGKELKVVCGGAPGPQLCGISNRLNPQGKELIRELHGFITLREEGEENAGKD